MSNDITKDKFDEAINELDEFKSIKSKPDYIDPNIPWRVQTKDPQLKLISKRILLKKYYDLYDYFKNNTDFTGINQTLKNTSGFNEQVKTKKIQYINLIYPSRKNKSSNSLPSKKAFIQAYQKQDQKEMSDFISILMYLNQKFDNYMPNKHTSIPSSTTRNTQSLNRVPPPSPITIPRNPQSLNRVPPPPPPSTPPPPPTTQSLMQGDPNSIPRISQSNNKDLSKQLLPKNKTVKQTRGIREWLFPRKNVQPELKLKFVSEEQRKAYENQKEKDEMAKIIKNASVKQSITKKKKQE